MWFLLPLLVLGPLWVYGLSSLPPRINPPAGALVVRANTTDSREFVSLIDAVAALPNDMSAQTIFVFQGTYEGQVNIQRSGPVTVSPPTHTSSSV